jgi:hypothetical protein
VVLGQVFSENFLMGFPCQSTFQLLLHNHLHHHPRLTQYAKSGRSANSLTNQNNNKFVVDRIKVCRQFKARGLKIGVEYKYFILCGEQSACNISEDDKD